MFDPFSINVSLLYPLKTLKASENRIFFDISRGHRSGISVENGSNISSNR